MMTLKKTTNFAFDDVPFRAEADMDLVVLEMAERSNKIVKNGVANSVVFNGLTYQLVTSPDTGRVWLDRNLGAIQACTSSTDSACYGDLYQWGRVADGHQLRTSSGSPSQLASISTASTEFIEGNSDWVTLTEDDNGALRSAAWANGGANDICPAGFSVPTEAEITADTISASTTDITEAATAFSSFLKIPAAGYRSVSGSISSVGSYAYLWSRSANGSNGRSLYATVASAGSNSDSRAYGYSVRCIKD